MDAVTPHLENLAHDFIHASQLSTNSLESKSEEKKRLNRYAVKIFLPFLSSRVTEPPLLVRLEQVSSWFNPQLHIPRLVRDQVRKRLCFSAVT